MRARLRHDPTALPDYEVLELLLGHVLLRRDTKPLAKELLARFGSLRGVLGSPQAVAEMARVRLAASPHEEVWVALLDTQNRMVAWERASRGTVNASAVYPREILELALRHKAASIILVHNHPGGNPSPSAGDIEITRQLELSAKAIGMRLLDHVIVTDDACYSLKDDGLI